MKHTVYKLFTIGQYEKEEQWLNEMSSKGMQLTDVGFCRYVFVEGTPGEYVYRLELLEHAPTNAQSIAYIRFMEDMGVEQVATLLYWVYFRKRAGDTPFDIYSDIPSKIKHFRRMNLLCNWAAGLNLVIGIVNIAVEAPANFSVGIVNVSLAVIILLIAIPIRKKLRLLRKESTVHE